MDKYGVCGVELQWFEDYLSNRIHYVIFINHPIQIIIVEYHMVVYWVVSEFCFSVFFADYTNMFITDKDEDISSHLLNDKMHKNGYSRNHQYHVYGKGEYRSTWAKINHYLRHEKKTDKNVMLIIWDVEINTNTYAYIELKSMKRCIA